MLNAPPEKSPISAKAEKVSLYEPAGLLVVSPRTALRVVSGSLVPSLALGDRTCLFLAGEEGAMLAWEHEETEGRCE